MTRLPAPFALAGRAGTGSRRLDDVAGGRFGRIAGVLLDLGQLDLQSRNPPLQRGTVRTRLVGRHVHRAGKLPDQARTDEDHFGKSP